jgi:hypothetical protein
LVGSPQQLDPCVSIVLGINRFWCPLTYNPGYLRLLSLGSTLLFSSDRWIPLCPPVHDCTTGIGSTYKWSKHHWHQLVIDHRTYTCFKAHLLPFQTLVDFLVVAVVSSPADTLLLLEVGSLPSGCWHRCRGTPGAHSNRIIVVSRITIFIVIPEQNR